MWPKQQLDKTAWQWAEHTDPNNIEADHVKQAYKLNLQPCKIGGCKRNCKFNPLCLNHVGEKVWFGTIDDSCWHDIEDPNAGRREEGMFVGLKNLGATCYVNTFLQLWFHNIALRKALYMYRDANFDVKKLKEPDVSKVLPESIAGHLQLIFALLDHTERQFIDPQFFINHLGLDTGEQQDAQEFSKLFLTLLEDSLSQQSDPFVRNIIQNLFRGMYAYVTTCSHCGLSSQRPSTFYELDLNIRGFKTLEECIKDFLSEEKLEGDNRYMCDNCASKVDAIRTIHLQELPPVLNFQLLRFVFDIKTGQKKKLNSFIQFPEVLDMNQFICKDKSQNAEDVDPNLQKRKDYTYHLTAVLIHRGPTAYSGHYLAHIKDKRSKVWFKYNDEEIEPMSGQKLQLGAEDDLQGTQVKKSRIPKGYHSSRNAYMLVYTLADSEYFDLSCSEHLLPLHIKEYVRDDNQKFENWVLEMQLMRDQNIESGKEQQSQIKEIFLQLVPKSNNPLDLEWFSLSWINTWLEDPKKCGEIDNKPLLCPHHKLDPKLVMKVKCFNREVGGGLYAKYGGGPRLLADEAMCVDCVTSQSRLINLKKRLTDDEKSISSAIKSSGVLSADSDENCFWVSKASLRSWKRLAMEEVAGVYPGSIDRSDQNNEAMEVDAKEGPSNDSACDMNLSDAEKTVNGTGNDNDRSENENNRMEQSGGRERKDSCVSDIPSEEEEMVKFNQDIQCEHGNLDPFNNHRKLIPECVWLKLKQYFPNCPEFSKNVPLCCQCNSQSIAEQEILELKKEVATYQKSILGDLFADRKRPLHLKVPQEVNVVSLEFVNSWRQFVRDPVKNEQVREILNGTLLCKHGGYLYPTALFPPDLSSNLDKLVYIWPSEWEIIKQCFTVDTEICVVKVEGENGISVFTMPEICEQCVELQKKEKEEAVFEYKDAVIYIRKVPKFDKAQEVIGPDAREKNDPDFNEKYVNDEPPEKMAKLDDGFRRKSNRHRRVRGEKELRVTSTQTLRSMKLEIMKIFSVPPFDQNLSIDGIPLTQDEVTLGELRIRPGLVIVLQADEPAEDVSAIQDMIQVSSGPESGFKGTGLLGNCV